MRVVESTPQTDADVITRRAYTIQYGLDKKYSEDLFLLFRAFANWPVAIEGQRLRYLEHIRAGNSPLTFTWSAAP